jgi:hypothetical protein
MVTAPKLIDEMLAIGPMSPVMEMFCIAPAAPPELSVTVSVATLFANPGVVPAVYWIPYVQDPPAAILTVLEPSKLQLTLGGVTVGATKVKLARFVPPITALVIFSAAPPGF